MATQVTPVEEASPSLPVIPEVIAAITALARKLEAVQIDTGLIRQDLDKICARLVVAEQRVGRVEDITEEHTAAIRTLQTKVKVLE